MRIRKERVELRINTGLCEGLVEDSGGWYMRRMVDEKEAVNSGRWQ